MIAAMVPRLDPVLCPRAIRVWLGSCLQRRLLFGDDVSRFEESVCQVLEARCAVATASARAGLYAILRSLGVGDGDEVIMSSYNTPIVPNVVRACGARPVFVDVTREHCSLDLSGVERRLSPRTRAIIVSHLDGFCADVQPVLDLAGPRKVFVIEDCAHAFGARYRGRRVGTLGDAGFFSLARGKQINALGGGVVTTNPPLAEAVRRMLNPPGRRATIRITRSFVEFLLFRAVSRPAVFRLTVYPWLYLDHRLGRDTLSVIFDDVGSPLISANQLAPLTNVQARLALPQLARLERDNALRCRNAAILLDGIRSDVGLVRQLPHTDPTWTNFTVFVPNRHRFQTHLLRHGIDTQRSWLKSCARDPAFSDESVSTPVSDCLARQAVCLPAYPAMPEEQLRFMAAQIDKAYQSVCI